MRMLKLRRFIALLVGVLVINTALIANIDLIFKDSFEVHIIAEFESRTLVNDTTSVPFYLYTSPPKPNSKIDFSVFRVTGPQGSTTRTRSLHSIQALQNGIPKTSIITDGDGLYQGEFLASYAGQGSVVIEFENSNEQIEIDLTNPIKTCWSCPEESGVSVGSSTGAAGTSKTDGSHVQKSRFTITRTYSSQSSHRRDITKGDVGADWAFTFVSDFLVPDDKNVVVYRPTNRTDLFTSTSDPDVFEAPMEYYESLKRNAQGNFELRSAGGTLKIYRGFNDPDIPGRLIRQEDRNGNFMSFLYAVIPGSTKQVLTAAVDSMGRNLKFRYYPFNDANLGRRGRLSEIEDFRRDNSASGRVWVYDYDEESNLVSVRSPTVAGTPIGNDFPQGKTTRYRYLTESNLPAGVSGYDRERLRHNIISIEYPNETASDLDPGNPRTMGTPLGTYRETLTYGLDPFDPANFDRVIGRSNGGTNANGIPAGGSISYEYQVLDPLASGANDPYMLMSRTDRRGNVTETTSAAGGTELQRRELTRGFRNSEPAAFVAQHQYNGDKKRVQTDYPEGNSVTYHFDSQNPDRFQQGNLLRIAKVPGPRGGDQTVITTSLGYEPIYQKTTYETDSRGADAPPVISPAPPPDPCGRQAPQRYTRVYYYDYQEGDPTQVKTLLSQELSITETQVQDILDAAGIALGLGDLNGDRDITPRIGGNIVRTEDPSVVITGPNQAAIEGDLCQEIVTLQGHNQYGKPVFTVDPEGNKIEYSYFPETDPDGDGVLSTPPADGRILDNQTGGYLKEVVRDTISSLERNNGTNPAPAMVRTAYTYDDVGNITSVTDGRGIRTDYFVNELDQVVQTTRAAAVPSQSMDEPMGLIAFAYRQRMFYDFNNNVVHSQVEDRGQTSDVGDFVDYAFHYDILDNEVERVEEIGGGQVLTYMSRYDANQNLVLSIAPEGNAQASIHDSRDLLFQSTRGQLNPPSEALGAPSGPYDPRGGTPSTTIFNYDLNGNLVGQVDADDTDGSSDNNSLLAGAGDATTFVYDGYDRRITVIDPVGNQHITNYDPVGNIVRVSLRGSIGGPSPTDPSGGANVDLSITESQFDEFNRLTQQDALLFMASGVVTLRPADITDGVLMPGDDKVTHRFEYDRNSRRTFMIEDDLDTSRIDYDGIGRTIKHTDPEGNTVEYAYDDNNNLIETRETDVAQIPGIASEVFLTTYFYDSLNRRQRIINNVGHFSAYRYDSRDNLVAMSDANGPMTGVSINRRGFSGGALTVNTINDIGNATVLYYDGINRRLRTDLILTASGQGTGATPGADFYGLKLNQAAQISIMGRDFSQSADGLISALSEWDRNSLQASLTDDNSNRTDYAYDNLNRRISTTMGICDFAAGLGTNADTCGEASSDPTTETVQYDPDDNTIIVTDENGTVVSNQHDAINRVTLSNAVLASGVVGSTEHTYEYDGLSRLTRATDNNALFGLGDDSVITFAWDSLSRVVEETQQIGSLSPKVISSGWNAENLRVALVYPNNRQVETTFDQLDRIDTIADNGAPQPIVDYNYIGKSRVLERNYPINGTRMTFLNEGGTVDEGYDGLRRTTQLRHLRSNDSLVVGFTHAYDRVNNRLNEEKLHNTVNNEEYSYDSTYRITNFDRPDPSAVAPTHGQWTLDGVGNWIGVDGETRLHSSFNEITEVDDGDVTTVTSDDNGNITDDGTYTFEWDYRNRLRWVTRKADGLLISVYIYDAADRRISKIVFNTGVLDGTTDYYYDGWRVLEERRLGFGLTQQYVYGNYIDEPLVLDRNLNGDPDSAIDAGDQRLFYHQNVLSSTHALSDTAGDILEGYLYDTYGRQTVFHAGSNGVVDFGGDDVVTVDGLSAVGNPYLFTGRRSDSETSLLYYRARYVNTEQGRFLSRDPVRSAGVSAYEYADSRPTRSLDPTGRDAVYYWDNETLMDWNLFGDTVVGTFKWRTQWICDEDGLRNTAKEFVAHSWSPHVTVDEETFIISDRGNPKFSKTLKSIAVGTKQDFSGKELLISVGVGAATLYFGPAVKAIDVVLTAGGVTVGVLADFADSIAYYFLTYQVTCCQDGTYKIYRTDIANKGIPSGDLYWKAGQYEWSTGKKINPAKDMLELPLQ